MPWPATSLTAEGPSGAVRDPIERIAAGLLILGITFSQRIALANILLGAAFLLWLAALVRGTATWRRAPIYPALLAWVMASLLAAACSHDPRTGAAAIWDLPTLALVPMAVSLMDGRRWDLMLRCLAVIATVSSSVGLWQYLHGASTLDSRLHGFVSHYMTFSGWTLIVTLLLAADIVFNGAQRRIWTVPVFALCCAVLALTYTRGVWIGLATMPRAVQRSIQSCAFRCFTMPSRTATSSALFAARCSAVANLASSASSSCSRLWQSLDQFWSVFSWQRNTHLSCA